MALVVVVVWAVLIAVVVRTHDRWDIRGLLVIGRNQPVAPALASAPTSPSGYDGPMYAALATDPFLRYLDTPHYLDAPSYRATRILIPLLAWAASLGHAPEAVVLYQLLCWGMALGAAVLLAFWLDSEGTSAWWALVAALGAGMVASMTRSTPDAGALLLALCALWLHRQGRLVAALALASAAVLARETSVIVPLAIAVEEARERRWRSAGTFMAVPASVGIGWQLYLRHVLGSAFNSGRGNFALPFSWLPHRAAEVMGSLTAHWVELFGTLAVLATAAVFVLVASRPSRLRAPELALLGFAAMGLILGSSVYAETWAYSRALVAVPFLAALVAARQEEQWRVAIVRLPLILYGIAGLLMLRGLLGEGALTGDRLTVATVAATRSLPRAADPATVGAGPRDATLPAASTCWVVPVASARGRGGSVWRTRLELENPNSGSLPVELDLLEGSGIRDERSRVRMVIEGHGRVTSQDAVRELFGRETVGALRVLSEGGRVVARALTTDAMLPQGDTQLALAATESDVVHAGTRAILRDLAYDPVHGHFVRSNVGLLNLTPEVIRIDIRGFDDGGRALGTVCGRLHPYGFAQVDDVFARLRAPQLRAGRLMVRTTTKGGAFLVYASVIRGPQAPPEYRRSQAAPR